jgi:hypothetical protein
MTPFQGVFHWSGVAWTSEIILMCLVFLGMALGLTLAASILFDRFDPSKWKPGQAKSAAAPPKSEVSVAKQAFPIVHLGSLTTLSNRFAFTRLLTLELKLLLKGQRWWWFAVAGGLIIAAFVNTPENVRAYVLPLTWLWPILIWSSLGNREIRLNVGQMVFSSAAP